MYNIEGIIPPELWTFEQSLPILSNEELVEVYQKSKRQLKSIDDQIFSLAKYVLVRNEVDSRKLFRMKLLSIQDGLGMLTFAFSAVSFGCSPVLSSSEDNTFLKNILTSSLISGLFSLGILIVRKEDFFAYVSNNLIADIAANQIGRGAFYWGDLPDWLDIPDWPDLSLSDSWKEIIVSGRKNHCWVRFFNKHSQNKVKRPR